MKNAFKLLAGATVLALTAGAHAAPLVGLTTDNRLTTFDSATPGSQSAYVAITGTAAGERIIGIDTGTVGATSMGQMWGVGTNGGIYTIDPTTGVASFKGSMPAGLIQSNLTYGVDFNIANDIAGTPSLRIVSSAGDNFAVRINNGQVGVVAFGMQNLPANFGGAAYNNFPSSGTANKGLYYIDFVEDSLYFTTSFNANPNPVKIGDLGVDTIGAFGFEAVSVDLAFAGFTDAVTGLGGLYSINLLTGAATLVGNFPNVSVLLNGLTTAPNLAPIPEPETYAMMLAGLGLIGYSVARRRKQA